MSGNHPYHVIKSPVLSEEATIQTSAHNKYTFKVDPRANKKQIKDGPCSSHSGRLPWHSISHRISTTGQLMWSPSRISQPRAGTTWY